MKFINVGSIKKIQEKIIDEVLSYLENHPAETEAEINEIFREQPEIHGYLFSDNYKVFTKREKEFLFFLSSVVLLSANKNEGFEYVDSVSISGAEEKNWSVFDAARGKTFKEKLDVFFENYEQEDLLAFVEDALLYDDEKLIDDEIKKIIFITLKSLIDVLV